MEKCYPGDPIGPDEIVEGKVVWPETRELGFHFKHPVTGLDM